MTSTSVFYGADTPIRGRGTAPLPAAIAAAGVSAGVLAALLGPVALAVPAAIATAWWLVRHPPALLAIYLTIGVFKGTPLLERLPVDVTLLLAALLALVCAERLLSGRALTVPLGFASAFVLLGTLLAVSVTWTPVPGYGEEKALTFWTLTALAAFAPFCLVRNAGELRSLLAWVLVAASVAAVVVLAFGAVISNGDISDSNYNRLEFGGIANTIFTSRLICAGIIVAAFAPAIGLGGRRRLFIPLLGVALLAVAAAIGSRGPILSALLAIVCTLLVFAVRNPRAAVAAVVFVAVAAAALPFAPLPETSVARLEGLARDPVGTLQTDGRSRLYAQAIELTREHPVAGIGSGGFFLYSPVLTKKDLRYPHNIVLEVSAEVGVAGALALVATIAVGFAGLCRRGWAELRQRHRMLIFATTALLLFTLFNAQLSGDINDNRMLWTALGLAWLIARHGVREESLGTR